MQLREKTEQGKQKDACIISGRELERIRETLNGTRVAITKPKFGEDLLSETAAKIRKEKMIKTDAQRLLEM